MDATMTNPTVYLETSVISHATSRPNKPMQRTAFGRTRDAHVEVAPRPRTPICGGSCTVKLSQ